MGRRPFAEPQVAAIEFKGGLDQTSSALGMYPGKLINADGVEILGNEPGYHRKAGYERDIDGRLASNMTVSYITIKTIVGTYTAEDEFTCAATSAIVIPLDTHATPAEDDVMRLAGSSPSISVDDVFTDGSNDFTVKTVTNGTSLYTAAQLQSHRSEAIEMFRGLIDPVPGDGNILGGFRLDGENYVFRNDSTVAKLYKGTDLTWTEITLPEILYFDEGTVELTVGDTLTGAGGATGTITSVTRQTGAWDAAEDAADQSAGYVTLTGVANGPFVADEVITDDGTGAAKVDVINTQLTLNPSGRYETKKHNFTNVANADSIFGVDGKNDAFQFDGTNYIPIFHPDATGYPNHIGIHQERLYLAFPGGELAYSVVLLPRIFNALLRGGSHSCGAEMTGMRVIARDAFVVYCANSYWLLTGTGVYDSGTSTHDWQFVEYDESIGAEEWSIAGSGDHLFLDNGNIRNLKATAAYGGFNAKPIAGEVQDFTESQSGNVTAAMFVKAKQQYRIFFSTGKAVYVAFSGGKYKGSSTLTFPDEVVVAWTAYEDQTEYLFFGSSDGYLYRMDSGNSCDDDYIEGAFRLPFYNYGSPRNIKLFPQITLELNAPVLLTGDTAITFTVNYSYGKSTLPRPIAETVTDIDGAGGQYGNVGSTYGSFVYGGPAVSEIVAYLDGEGVNMSLLVTFKTRYDSSFAFLNALVDYIKLGIARS